MDAIEVKPQKWMMDNNYPIRVLYDDGSYSVIWGKYEDKPALGVRWNGEDDIGFPRQGDFPTWYVEPDFIAASILQTILTYAINEENQESIENILFAQQELAYKMVKMHD